MARIRTIKPEFWADEDLSELPVETHMLAAALLNHADDEGYFNANPKLVKAQCCPLRDDSVSVQESLKMLSEIGYLQIGNGADGKRYGRIRNFTKHQKINRPSASKISEQTITWENSVNPHGVGGEDSPPEGNRDQGTGIREQGTGEPDSSDPPSTPKEPPCPPNVSESVWTGYVEHRRAKRARLTDHAVKLLTRKLEDLSQSQADRCLELSIENGWTGVFPEQVQKSGGKTPATGKRDYREGIGEDGSF